MWRDAADSIHGACENGGTVTDSATAERQESQISEKSRKGAEQWRDEARTMEGSENMREKRCKCRDEGRTMHDSEEMRGERCMTVKT